MPDRPVEGPGYVQRALVRYDSNLKERVAKFDVLRYQFLQKSILHIPPPSVDDCTLPPAPRGIRRDPINGLGLTKRHTRGYMPLMHKEHRAPRTTLPSLTGGSVNQSIRYQATMEGFRDIEKEEMKRQARELSHLREEKMMKNRAAKKLEIYQTRNYSFPLSQLTRQPVTEN